MDAHLVDLEAELGHPLLDHVIPTACQLRASISGKMVEPRGL